MPTEPRHGSAAPRRLPEDTVRAWIPIHVLLFAIATVDILVLRFRDVPDLLVSRITGPLVLIIAMRLLGTPPRTIGLHARHLGPAALVGGGVLTVLYLLLYGFQTLRLAGAADPPQLVIGVLDGSGGVLHAPSFTLLFLLTTVLNSFLEEGMFRGVMLPQLMRRFPFGRANVVQATLFALWHLPLAIAGWSSGEATGAETVAQGITLMAATGTAGLVFGYLYHRTGSLWAPWLAHTIDNVVLNVVHLRTTAGVNVETEVALVASFVGYPLLALAAWRVANRRRLPKLAAWPTGVTHPVDDDGGPPVGPSASAGDQRRSDRAAP